MRDRRSWLTPTLQHRAAAVVMGLLLLVLAALPARSKGSGDGAGPRGESYDLSWYSVDGGGAMFSTGGSFSLGGTIGQADAGVMAGGDFELIGGFWPGAASTGISGDCDDDGDVDLDDYTGLEACLFGPGGGLGTGCECFDFDGDGEVTLVDFANFQVGFTGG